MRQAPIGWSVVLIVCAFIGWNFWLAGARDAFMEPATWHPQGQPNQDFVAYYTGGKSFGADLDPYRDNGRVDPELADPGDNAPYSRYKYPPTLLPLWELLSRLEYDRARSVWVLFYLAVYLAGLAVLLGITPRSARPVLAGCAAVLSITSDSILEHIQHGQVDMVVAGVVAASFAAHARGYRGWSAAILALGFLIKVNPIVFLIYYVLFCRDFGYAVRFGLFAGLGAAASLIWVPAQLYVGYLTEVLPHAATGTADFHNQSIIRLFAGTELLPQAASLIGLGAFAGFAWWMGARAGSDAPTRQAVFLMNAVAILLFSGLAWHMTFCWMLLPASLLLAHLDLERDRIVVPLVLVCTFLTNARLWEVTPFDSLGMIGGTGLLATLAWFVIRRASGEPGGTHRAEPLQAPPT